MTVWTVQPVVAVYGVVESSGVAGLVIGSVVVVRGVRCFSVMFLAVVWGIWLLRDGSTE
jgi:hypothetical protein